jgi:hypothetical protein
MAKDGRNVTDDLPEIALAEFQADDGLLTERQATAELGVRTAELPEPVARLVASGAPLYERDAIREAVKRRTENLGAMEYVGVDRETGALVGAAPGGERYARHLYGCYVMDQRRNLDRAKRDGWEWQPRPLAEIRDLYYPCQHCH